MSKWDYNIKIKYIKDMGFKDVEWIYLSLDKSSVAGWPEDGNELKVLQGFCSVELD
jgi:hypothetical protein